MTIYFIRHAQSEFNAAFHPHRIDPMIFDAPLSKLGERQAVLAQSNIRKLDINQVYVSPFTRTLQTAALIFGEDYPVNIRVDVREQLSNSCDVGSSPDKLAEEFPHLDFNHLPSCWWHQGEKDNRGIAVEPHEVLVERANVFTDYLINNNIHSTAIVSHGNFIKAITDIQAENCEIIEFDPNTRVASSRAKI